MYGPQFITNITRALQITVPNLIDPVAAKVELHGFGVEELARDLATVDALKLQALEKPETVSLGEIEKTLKNARQRGLECLQRAVRLAKDRTVLLTELEADKAKALEAAEDFHKAEWTAVESGLANVGVTVESLPSFHAAPDESRHIIDRQIKQTQRVRDAQARVDQASNDLNSVRGLQENAATIVAGVQKELNDFIAGIVG